ncbi:hypothetical protein KFK09_014177 [Dendrobium nobile]|uniref:FAR1 domain-containing protein n=1 Tax=Dendrobium nobile TaxID=94219 RepID=A0A8T3B959_DENNO|nr:hypothetical protein KFK09_014177 [Dendrobium nobile]
MPMKMEIDLDLEEDAGFYEQTIFSQVSEEADNLENADVQETSAHEAEHVEPVILDEKFSLSDVYVNEKEAYEAYRKYGYNLGFSVHKDHHSYWPNSRNLKSKDFVCSKAGFKKLPDLNIQRKYRRSDTRTGCPAMIRFTVDEEKVMRNWRRNEQYEDYKCSQSEIEHVIKNCSILKKFEMMNLLYSHCIIVLRQMAIGKIPEKYLLLRWFAYEMSTRAQLNEGGEEFLLAAMKDTSEKLDLIVFGKRKTYKSTQGDSVQLKDPLKRRPKGISNARLKSHWEKKTKRKPLVKKYTTKIETPSSMPECMPECLTEDFINFVHSKQPSAQ